MKSDKFTDGALALLERANAEAVLRGQGYVGSEDLLLALLAAARCPYAKLLSKLGVKRAKVLQVLEMFGPYSARPAAGARIPALPLTDKAREILQDAGEEAIKRGHIYLGIAHILLSMLAADEEFLALKIMKRLGLKPVPAYKKVEAFLEKRNAAVRAGC